MIKPTKAADLKSLIDWDARDPYTGISRYLTRNYRAERKYDGCGVFIYLNETRNEVISATRGLDRSQNFPSIENAVFPELAGTILQAEMIAPDSDGKIGGLLNKSVGLMVAGPDLARRTQKMQGDARFYIFDILRVQGNECRDLRYWKRRELLETVVGAMKDKFPDAEFHLVASEPATRHTIEKARASGAEGVVLKRIDGTYRSGGQFKVKFIATGIDVFVTGWRPGLGSNAGKVGSFEVSVMRPDWTTREIGHCGNFTTEFRNTISAPDGTLRAEWYGAVVEVTAQGMGPDGHLRGCLLSKLRPDKGPDDCPERQLDDLAKA